jgi:hypothetical protein
LNTQGGNFLSKNIKKSFVRPLIMLLIVVNLLLWVLMGLRLTTIECVSKGIVGPNAQEKRIVTHFVSSSYQGGSMMIRVITPEHFQPGKKYKVIYILPTGPQQWDFWWNNGIVEAIKYNIHNQYDIILVAPSIEKMPWFGDNPQDPKVRQESYIVRVVVPFIDEHYPTERSPEGRLLLGLSKAGCGAFTLCLRYPEIFGKAVAWDPPLLYGNIKEDPRACLVDVFGTEENFKQYSLPLLLRQRVTLLQGKPPRLILMGYGILKDHIEEAHVLMQSLNIPHIYDNSIKREHKWQSGWLPEAVKYLMQQF